LPSPKTCRAPIWRRFVLICPMQRWSTRCIILCMQVGAFNGSGERERERGRECRENVIHQNKGRHRSSPLPGTTCCVPATNDWFDMANYACNVSPPHWLNSALPRASVRTYWLQCSLDLYAQAAVVYSKHVIKSRSASIASIDELHVSSGEWSGGRHGRPYDAVSDPKPAVKILSERAGPYERKRDSYG